MCVREFLAYYCGHCSVAVLRPCVMTTHSHRHPVCSMSSLQPFLTNMECPGCARIRHTRRILIEEYEHRFMHERGACGCDVVFPDILRPRIIGVPPPSCDEQDVVSTAEDPKGKGKGKGKGKDKAVAAAGEMRDKGKGKGKGKGKETDSWEAGVGVQSTGAGADSTIPSVYQEINTGDTTHVAIRLSSWSGAEWVADHRQIHADGGCHCPADFSFYQPRPEYPAEHRELHAQGRCPCPADFGYAETSCSCGGDANTVVAGPVSGNEDASLTRPVVAAGIGDQATVEEMMAPQAQGEEVIGYYYAFNEAAAQGQAYGADTASNADPCYASYQPEYHPSSASATGVPAAAEQPHARQPAQRSNQAPPDPRAPTAAAAYHDNFYSPYWVTPQNGAADVADGPYTVLSAAGAYLGTIANPYADADECTFYPMLLPVPGHSMQVPAGHPLVGFPVGAGGGFWDRRIAGNYSHVAPFEDCVLHHCRPVVAYPADGDETGRGARALARAHSRAE